MKLRDMFFPWLLNFYFSDFSKIFNFKFIHLGGDEVNTGNSILLFMMLILFVSAL